MAIVVTGARGQLGSELCRQLGERAVPLEVQQCDLTDSGATRQTIARLRPAAVINCAAYTAVDRAEQEADRCRAVNATAVECLAQSCGALGAVLVQVSTDYVFGGTGRGRPWHEDDEPGPQGVYAQTKRAGEVAAARCDRHLVVRTCGLYTRLGEPNCKNFVNTMLSLGRSGKVVRVVDDQHCTPSYVPHVARAIVFLTEAARRGNVSWGTYHVTNAGATTWFEFAAEVFRLAGLTVDLQRITTAQYAAPAPRPAYSVLDTTRYDRLGGPSLPDWKTALRECFGGHSQRETKER